MQASTAANNDADLSVAVKRQSDDKTDGLPRLMGLKQAAKYIGVSYWLLRDCVIDGTLRPVRLPGSRLRKNGKVTAKSRDHLMRKILVDRKDLDQLIADCKGF
jgi:hypothetical protein